MATLVARGVSHDELFAAVNEEVAWLVGADPTALMRFEADDTVTLAAAWSAADAAFGVGARRAVDDGLRSIRDGERGLRFGPMELPLAGPFVEEARELAIRSAVGVPIVVDGRVWGAAFAASTRDDPLPADTETRLAPASRMPLPVEIGLSVDRLPAPVEATAYFVIAEALTNVAKHARAGHAEVTARIEHGTLAVQVRDDGVGGARLDGGGLNGLADRLAAVDGELRVQSPANGGTLVAAAVPLPG